ncbi:acylneuraminate cytidylyltransferase family protein [Flavobacterium sp. MAH-1]|uniref:Acylneuraminate cytidylyltransferase family protein n=1 Tax=Flavobacterium agri TaxID=2743471 RepID=A0A7Y9C5E4_9FLAO|nr:acylneuraminate cytidylyltransferase family protein [Flavobacterium agri]NUY80896.1 acylneuraminate cytidylyltransferase family protein [Flavobacterium agri]NYA70920.1 acylneuraminate cytidylyltransferase family protein [Flavobacterium agri]
MRILGLIPARGGSKGIPGKNIKPLAGKPVLAYTAEAALQSDLLVKTILSTDDEAIAEVGNRFGIDVPFLRPSEFAQDGSPTLGVILHALEFLENSGEHFDAVCLLQPTTPFRVEGFVDEAISRFVQSNADSLVSVLPVPHEYNPHWTFEADDLGLLKIATGEQTIIPRRQELPQAWHRDGSVYITKTDVLKSGSLYGNSVAYIENDPKSHVNLDTQADWEKAEILAKALFNS